MKLATLKQYIVEKVRNNRKDLITQINEMTEVSHLQFKEQLVELCSLSKDLIRIILQNITQKKQEVLSFYIKSNPFKAKILEKALETAMKGNQGHNIPAALHEKLKRIPKFWASQESESLNRFKLVESPLVKTTDFRKEVPEQENAHSHNRRNFTTRDRNTATPDNMRGTKQDLIQDILRVTSSDKKRKSQFSTPNGKSQTSLRLFEKDIKLLKDKIQTLKSKEKKVISYSASNSNIFLSAKDFQMKPWTSSAAREKNKLATGAGSRSKHRKNSRSQDYKIDSNCLSS